MVFTIISQHSWRSAHGAAAQPARLLAASGKLTWQAGRQAGVLGRPALDSAGTAYMAAPPSSLGCSKGSLSGFNLRWQTGRCSTPT